MATLLKRVLKRLLRRQPEPLQDAVRNLWNEFRITRSARRWSRQLQPFQGKTNLKVHLGCGGELKPGWINIDVARKSTVPPAGPITPQDVVVVNYDLRRGALPLADGSCDIIYSSHFFEYLECKQGFRLMRDSFRALRSGGKFRVSLPNFRGLFRAYLERDLHHLEGVDIRQVFPDMEPGTETLVDHVNYGVYQFG